MRTTAFGCVGLAITVLTIAIVLHICNISVASGNLESDLKNSMDSSLEMAMINKDYSIANANELVADVIEDISTTIPSNASLDVDVNSVDTEKGILSMTVTEHVPLPSGNTKDVTCSKTVILDSAVDYTGIQFGEYFYINDTDSDIYKSYDLSEGDGLHTPKDPEVPGKVFKGWRYKIFNADGSYTWSATLNALDSIRADTTSYSTHGEFKFYAEFN